MTARRLVELDAATRRREIVTTILSLVVTWAALIGVYALIGSSRHNAWTAPGILVVGGLLLGASLSRQLRQVVVADIPGLRAVQALGASVVLFLVLFASAYLALSADSFSRPLNQVSALYFTITVFSTVGFGDITPETDPARILVAVQMLLDLVLIGLIVRSFVSAVRVGLTVGGDEDDDASTTDGAAGAQPG